MSDLYQSVQEAADYLRRAMDFPPTAAFILGTGLGGMARNVEVRRRIPYETIPHFPASTVEGHQGSLILGTLAGCRVMVMQGRFHYYEGYSLQQTTLPVRIARELGAEFLFANSAAGGLNPHFRACDVMIVTDHLNLIGENPLRGVIDERMGERFPDMSRPYDQELMSLAESAARDLKIPIRHGVYAAVPGPSLETRAETRMLRLLGADAVGMSTVPEVIVANQVGLKTLVLAAVTNVNLPDAMNPVSIAQVIANAEQAQVAMAAILEAVLKGIAVPDLDWGMLTNPR